MASTIDPNAIDVTVPATGEASTASVRANFAALKTQLTNAKTDIDGLQTPITGPQGPQGEQGIQGVPGPAGPTGPAGSVETFNASGTWTKPDLGGSDAWVVVDLWGGGGGGNARDGGGGGAYSRYEAFLSALPASVAVTVGLGGVGTDVLPDPVFAAEAPAGLAGGDTSFGTIAFAAGGQGATSLRAGDGGNAYGELGSAEGGGLGGRVELPSPSFSGEGGARGDSLWAGGGGGYRGGIGVGGDGGKSVYGGGGGASSEGGDGGGFRGLSRNGGGHGAGRASGDATGIAVAAEAPGGGGIGGSNALLYPAGAHDGAPGRARITVILLFP